MGAWQLDSGAEQMIRPSRMHAIFDVPTGTPTTRERMLDRFNGIDLRRRRQPMDDARPDASAEMTARMTTTTSRRRLLKIRLRGLGPTASMSGIIGSVQAIDGKMKRPCRCLPNEAASGVLSCNRVSFTRPGCSIVFLPAEAFACQPN